MNIANTCTIFTLIFIQQYSVIPDIHNEKKGIFLIQKEKNMYMEEKLYQLLIRISFQIEIM